jgi:hypothetical protein
MNSKPGSFQLEKKVPGTFLMQGLLGGVLGGYVAAIIAGIAWNEDNFIMTLDLTALLVFTGGIVGIVKATFMWGLVRLTGIKYRAATRVTTTSILATLFTAVIGRQFNFDEEFLRGSMVWSLSVGIPIALLVGSGVKPWKLFTFGSIAGGDVGHRSGLRIILATLGTLPLRFISIGAIVSLLLYITSQYTWVELNDFLVMTLLMSIAVSYPAFSAYITFRSPRKVVLLVLGLVINFPVTLIWVIAFREYLNEIPGRYSFMFTAISSLFIVAWVIFLIARLSVRIGPLPSLSITSNKSIADAPNLDHECLGSRFVEWQQRVA